MSTMQAKLSALENGVSAATFSAAFGPEGTGGFRPDQRSGPAPRVSLG